MKREAAPLACRPRLLKSVREKVPGNEMPAVRSQSNQEKLNGSRTADAAAFDAFPSTPSA